MTGIVEIGIYSDILEKNAIATLVVDAGNDIPKSNHI